MFQRVNEQEMMQQITSQPPLEVGGVSAEQSTRLMKTFLACGVITGPLYIIVGLDQAFTRPGFDILRHDLSLLANGDLGWIQSANFVVTGLLVIAGAVGTRQALPPG